MTSVFAELATYSALVERLAEAEALSEREERLRSAISSAQLGTWDWYIAEGRLVWNEQNYCLLGLEPDATDPSVACFESCIHPDDRRPLCHALVAALETGTLFQYEYRVIWADGSLHWLVSTGRTVPVVAGPAVRMTGVTAEVSAHKVNEAQLRQVCDQLDRQAQVRAHQLSEAHAARQVLMRELVEAQEHERRRLARDLHDQAAQQATAILLGLKRLQAHSYGRAETLQEIEQIQTLVQAMSHEMHRLATNLRPVALDNLGLIEALQAYLDNWSRHTQIAAELLVIGIEPHTARPEVAMTVYQVAIEALTNVARHAAATRVSLILERVGTTLTAIIEDDGRGFVVEQVLQETDQGLHLGLIGMHERVTLIDGSLSIESQPGQGAAVLVRIPLAFADPRLY